MAKREIQRFCLSFSLCSDSSFMGIIVMNIIEFANYINNHQKFVFDSGVILAYLQDENDKLTEILNDFIFSEQSQKLVICNQITFTEIFYIHCRKYGFNKATKLIDDIRPMFEVLKVDSLNLVAGKLKCKYPIALSDCFSIASGIVEKAPVLFINENELTETIQKQIEKEYNINLVIIEIEE